VPGMDCLDRNLRFRDPSGVERVTGRFKTSHSRAIQNQPV
jgi:hypothetical protein